jgi:hypothetical protein
MTTPLSDPDNVKFTVVENYEPPGFTDDEVARWLNGEPLGAATLVASPSGGDTVSRDNATMTSEDDAMTAASAAEDGACEEGYVRVGDGSCMAKDEFERERRWTGTLVVEGVTTGDHREFAPNAITWDTNVLIRWQKEGAHGGEHDVTVTVGRADKVWRDGNQIKGSGILDLRSEDGYEIYRRLKDGFAGGISIDADDIAAPDIEVVWPETPDAPSEDANPLMLLFGSPEKVVYHAGRIRAATLVDIPAFVEARIALAGDDAGAVALAPAVVTASRRPVSVHATATSDLPWDAKTHMSRLPRRINAQVARAAYAWVHGEGELVVPQLLHHEVDSLGNIGPANLTACAAAIAKLNGDHSSVSIPDDEIGAVYEHLAAHLRDAGQTPPPLQRADSLAAGAVLNLNDQRPPSLWFRNPGLTVPVGITVTDQGRVYGHAAQWGECHVGFDDICVTPPHEDSHSYFMTGEVLCADGTRVAVGQITVGTGHAPLSYRASRAVEHYDNTGSVVADVAVGNDEIGIWVAGAVRPHAEQARVYDLRASGRVSGDWRRIGGQLRLVGLLGVNVPGFPLKTRARVASGVPTSLVAAGFMSVGNALTEDEQNALAMQRVMGMLRKRITKGE